MKKLYVTLVVLFLVLSVLVFTTDLEHCIDLFNLVAFVLIGWTAIKLDKMSKRP